MYCLYGRYFCFLFPSKRNVTWHLKGKYNLACVASVSALLSTQAINNRNALNFASICFNNKYMTSSSYTEPVNLRNMYTNRLKLLRSSFFQSV